MFSEKSHLINNVSTFSQKDRLIMQNRMIAA